MKTPTNTDHVIVTADRGWIYIGYKDNTKTDSDLLLVNAQVVRKWSNGRGIGGLANPAYKDDYTLDPPKSNDGFTVSLPTTSVVSVIECQW